jgi:hypothetical protein
MREMLSHHYHSGLKLEAGVKDLQAFPPVSGLQPEFQRRVAGFNSVKS